MTLSLWVALFWGILVAISIAAIQTRNRWLMQAMALLACHQAIGLAASLLMQDKAIWHIYGLLSFAAWALAVYLWPSSAPRWTQAFTAGFVMLLGLNAVAYWTNTVGTWPVWPMTAVLYAMMGIVLWRVWHERRQQGSMGHMVSIGSVARHKLVAAEDKQNQNEKAA